MTTPSAPNEPSPTDENLDELHTDHDTTFPAVEDEPTADEPAPMAGDSDLQSGHLGE